jgi:hypothetical protein
MLLDAFQQNQSVIPFELNRRLTDLFPNQSILYTQDDDFDFVGFARDGHCAVWSLEDLNPLIAAWWYGRTKGTEFRAEHALTEIMWNGHRLKCLKTFERRVDHLFLIADSPQVAQKFFEAVCMWNSDSDRRVTVFDGRFRRDPELEEALLHASWESLVLEEGLKDRLQHEVNSFFGSKEIFERYGITWRRGILLYGPPGNGKTHAIKALLNLVAKPCLVIRSLSDEDDSDESVIGKIFVRARHMAPAVVLFEDIDSLVSRSHLSCLLNELDGLAKNDGLLFIATTNHLDQLDSALSNRPSRFDRKFEIGNPKLPERERFLGDRFERFESDMRPSPKSVEDAAKLAKGFSGAMLQELVSACALAWVRAPEPGQMDLILPKEIEALRPKDTV